MQAHLTINCHFIPYTTLSLSFTENEIDHAAVVESGVSPLLQQVSVQTALNMLQSQLATASRFSMCISGLRESSFTLV